MLLVFKWWTGNLTDRRKAELAELKSMKLKSVSSGGASLPAGRGLLAASMGLQHGTRNLTLKAACPSATCALAYHVCLGLSILNSLLTMRAMSTAT